MIDVEGHFAAPRSGTANDGQPLHTQLPSFYSLAYVDGKTVATTRVAAALAASGERWGGLSCCYGLVSRGKVVESAR
jgi:hypothetical protein